MSVYDINDIDGLRNKLAALEQDLKIHRLDNAELEQRLAAAEARCERLRELLRKSHSYWTNKKIDEELGEKP